MKHCCVRSHISQFIRHRVIGHVLFVETSIGRSDRSATYARKKSQGRSQKVLVRARAVDITRDKDQTIAEKRMRVIQMNMMMLEERKRNTDTVPRRRK